MFEDLLGTDLPGSGRWRVGGEVINPVSLPCPLLNIVSTTDRIVPHATAPHTGERLDLALGHVGMVVGAKGRQALWEPLAAWLSRAAAKC
jgi:polyhydroxyalkanoate synthase